MTANERILRRLQSEIERYRTGETSLERLQHAVLSHGSAVEGLGNEWHELVRGIEGTIDSVRFTVAEEGQAEAISPHLDHLNRAISDALGRTSSSGSV